MDECSGGFPSSAGARAVAVPADSPAAAMSTPPVTFHELYTRHADDVYRFAYWLCGNEHDARDITSETFVRAWTGTAEIRRVSVKAYLFAIARNFHLYQSRRRARQVPFDDAIASAPDPASEPGEHASTSDDLQRTFAALARLPELDRTLLLLRAEGGFSHGQIAVLTGLSEAAVKVRVFRARLKLLSLLSPVSRNQP